MNFRKLLDRTEGIGLCAALVLAFAAQYLFAGETFTRNLDPITWETWKPGFAQGAALLLTALVCAIWVTPGRRDGQPGHGPPTGAQAPARPGPLRDRDFFFLSCAGGCTAVALLLYGSFGETWVVQAFWLLGIGLIAAGLWRSQRASPLMGGVAWWEWGLVAGLTGLGFALRYWKLTEIPAQLDQDIPYMGVFVRNLIWNSNYNWIGASASGHLLAYDQSLAWSMRLFGENHYGLVMHSVLFGTLTIPLVFLLGREMFGPRVGLIAASLLTTEYTAVHFSRTMFGPLATFFAVLALYLLLAGRHRRQPLAFAAAGVAAGISITSYDSSRVIPVILLAVGAWELLWRREAVRAGWRHWAALALGGLIGFGPMLVFAATHFTEFVGRGNVVMLWEPEILRHQMSAYQVTTLWDVLVEQTRRTFLTLHLYGDRSPHFTFPRPMVSAPTAALMVVGLGGCLSRLRSLRAFTLVAWLGLTFVLGGVLTYDPPYWPHLNIALPAVVLMAALAADRILTAFSPPPGEFGHLSLHLILAIALAVTGIHSWQVYYDYAKDRAGPRNTLSRYLRTFPPGYQVYLLDSIFTWNESAFQFFNGSIPAWASTSEDLIAFPPSLDRPTLFVFSHSTGLINFLKTAYPGGVVQEHYNWEGWLFFVSYEYIPPGMRIAHAPAPFNPLRLPGWWLIGGALALLGGRAGFLVWKTLTKGDGLAAKRAAPVHAESEMRL